MIQDSQIFICCFIETPETKYYGRVEIPFFSMASLSNCYFLALLYFLLISKFTRHEFLFCSRILGHIHIYKFKLFSFTRFFSYTACGHNYCRFGPCCHGSQVHIKFFCYSSCSWLTGLVPFWFPLLLVWKNKRIFP